MSNQLENRRVFAVPSADYAVPRQPPLLATFPLLKGETTVDLATLQRVAAALRAAPAGQHRARPGTSADIARLRREMGNTIAGLWAAPPDEVSGAC
jgi:hypothetical protein